MRTFGRVTDPQTGARWWVQVNPDANGFNDSIYLTTLCQVLKLNLGESPFFADWGIPALQSVWTQIQPDYYVLLTQQRFAPHFMFLGLVKLPEVFPPVPTYNLTVIFHNGARDSTTVIPEALVDGLNRPVVDGHGVPISTGMTKNGFFVAQ